ncbi:hypothetical protein FKP32DRAFT_1590758 [Trametes sanguinea]|nr:hypothetical protein FKP32DRAFT_1590758 [Trametes sanguinea]
MLHHGYDIWISDSDGQRLPEHAMRIEGDDGKTAGCFIPSESGKRFVINWRDYNKAHHTDVRISVDGVFNVGNICRPGKKGSRIGVRTNAADKYNPFQFADLRTTDNDSAPLTEGHVSPEKVGTIEVRVVRIHPQTSPVPFKPRPLKSVGPVHERTKKLGAHCVTLGEGIKKDGRPLSRSKARPLNRREGPYATFVFRYRPAALLQAQGIAPPAPAFGLDNEGPRQPPGSSRRRELRPRVKPEARPHACPTSQADVIELSDSEESVDRKPVLRIKREAGIRRSVMKSDSDDVIDLTVDE